MSDKLIRKVFEGYDKILALRARTPRTDFDRVVSRTPRFRHRMREVCWKARRVWVAVVDCCSFVSNEWVIFGKSNTYHGTQCQHSIYCNTRNKTIHTVTTKFLNHRLMISKTHLCDNTRSSAIGSTETVQLHNFNRKYSSKNLLISFQLCQCWICNRNNMFSWKDGDTLQIIRICTCVWARVNFSS